MDINEFDDSISSIWMNLKMQDWNDCLFPFLMFDNNRNENEKEINLQ